MTRHLLAASTALAATLFFTSTAFAQDTAVTPQAAPTTTAANAPVADDNQVQDIVVTATKRETSLQSTPIAISAFSQAQLDKQQVKDVTDLAKFVPSLQFNQQGDQSAILLTLRGIGNDSAYTEVADPEVAIYVDGIYSPRAQGASVLFYDLERVEVLRGPQGTLFGRNATVGALSLVSAKPTFDGFHANVEAVGGSYNRFGIKGMINMPVTDNFALRAAFITDRHDGYIDYQQAPNVPGVDTSAFVTRGKKYYAGDQKSARLSARWDLDRFHWTLSGEYFKDTGSPILSLMQTPRPGQKFWSAQIDSAPEQNRYSVAVRSNMSYDVSDKIQLAYIAGWSRIGGSTIADSDAGAIPPGSVDPASGVDETLGNFGENSTVWSRYDFGSHELQLKSVGKNKLDWIIGGYYSHEVNTIRFDVDQRNLYRNGTFSWAGSFIQPDREVDSHAVFGQATYHLGDHVRLTGGIRYTSDTKQDKGGRNVTYTGSDCSVADTQPGGRCTTGLFGQHPEYGPGGVASIPGYDITALNDVKGKWDKVTWLARADADITDGLLGYASVSTGFKSGNIEDGGRTADPETLTNYEVGLKSKLFDNHVTVNLAAYYSDFKGYQVNQAITTRDANDNVTGSQIVITNAKGAKSYGLEAEINANITRNDRVQFAATIQKTKLDDLLTVDGRLYNAPTPDLPTQGIEDLKGNELAHAPRFSMTGTYEHDFEMENGGAITPRFTLHYETRSWLTYFNGDDNSRYSCAGCDTAHVPGNGGQGYGSDWDKQKSYAKIDLAVRYTSPAKTYFVEAFTLNVTDKKIRTSAGTFGPTRYSPVFLSNYQPPRTWGVRVGANF